MSINFPTMPLLCFVGKPGNQSSGSRLNIFSQAQSPGVGENSANLDKSTHFPTLPARGKSGFFAFFVFLLIMSLLGIKCVIETLRSIFLIVIFLAFLQCYIIVCQ